MNRDRVLSIFLAGALSGVVLSGACGPFPGKAHAQEDAGECGNWEVAMFLKNSGDADTLVEFLPLGIPSAFDIDQYPQSEDDAAFAIPAGWEPFGYGATGGDAGAPAIIVRRCVQ